jgi:hypothetical protein
MVVGLQRRDKMERTGFSDSGRSAAPNLVTGLSQISGGGADLVGGILKSILELKYKG